MNERSTSQRGFLGVIITVICAMLMGSGALYQALRVHQRQASRHLLDQAVTALSGSTEAPRHSQTSPSTDNRVSKPNDVLRISSSLEVRYIKPLPSSLDVSEVDESHQVWRGPRAVYLKLISRNLKPADLKDRGTFESALDQGVELSRPEDKPWFDGYWSSRAHWRDADGAAWSVSPVVLSGSESRSSARWVIRQPAPRAPKLPWVWLIIAALITLICGLALTPLLERSRWFAALTPLTGLPIAWVVSDVVAAREAATEVMLEGAVLVSLSALLPLIMLGLSQCWTRGRRSKHRVAYTYMAPTLVTVGMLVFVPFALGVLLAFTRHHQGSFEWVGLAHFIDILSASGRELSDPLNFYFTLGVTLLWTFVNVVLHLSIGLAFALLLNLKGLKLTGVYRALLIIPWAIPNYITALIWKGMFNHQYGMINALLESLGITSVNWMGSFWGAMTANIATNTWLGFPFMMVVALGALQSIPTDLYEAARVAGASRWVQFRSITLPLLKPALLPAVILGSVWTFNMFNIIYLVSGGQPVGATDILITEAYRWAFEQDRYGYAAAYSLVIFFILLGYAGLTQRLSRSAEEVYR